MTKYEIKLCSWLHKLQDIRADVDEMCETKIKECKKNYSNETVPSEHGDTLHDNIIKLDNICDCLAEAISYIKDNQKKNQFKS